MTFAQAAQKAIELGGKFDGHEAAGRHQRLHQDVGDGARRSGPDGRGQGRVSARRPDAVLRRRLRGSRSRHRNRRVTDRRATRRSPTSARSSTRAACRGQLFGGVDARHRPRASRQQWVYDQHYGVPLAKRFHHNKPPTILDAPIELQFGGASTLPDPETPVGVARRRRAAGRRRLRRDHERASRTRSATRCSGASPVTPDMILTALENGGKRTHEPSRRISDVTLRIADCGLLIDDCGISQIRNPQSAIRERHDMAVIRDVMPAFELFQPATIDDALSAARSARRRCAGCWRAGSTASTG